MSSCVSHRLHALRSARRTWYNRAFAAAYAYAALTLVSDHAHALLRRRSAAALLLLAADVVLGLLWVACQSYRMRPVRREEFPENLGGSDLPAMDVFICTADPYKEPPMSVVNTALSVMGFDYPAERVSVYVSDDGGSELTLFAFAEAARFAAHWLPFCRDNDVVERSPQAYFASGQPSSSRIHEDIKNMYESMKIRVENAVERGRIDNSVKDELEAFQKWTDEYTRQDHPTVIQVLLENGRDKDITGHAMPNLIYVSREKSSSSPHHFKAGALNVLVRVSAVMTNSPVILTLDCDMYSNDPQTPSRALCYLCDPVIQSTLGYVQFPQIFVGIDKNDIYACEHKRLYKINLMGMDGFKGPNYVGTGCFFRRRAFFGPPSSLVSPEIRELSPNHDVDKPITAESVLATAYQVATCEYEKDTKWGYKMGFRYGTLSEDYFTGFHMHCEGWRSVFCYPQRAAFLGDVPISLIDVLTQNKRWVIGQLEVGFSKFSTITYGVKYVGLLMGLTYSHIAFWSLWSIPITVYAFLPPLALLNGLTIFPKVSEPRFLLYLFLFHGAYGQDLFEYVSEGGTVLQWWSDQRMWMIKGVTSYLFGLVEFTLKSLHISQFGFNVTSKVVDVEQIKRYQQGTFDFGVASPMFVPLAMAAIINLLSLSFGVFEVARGGRGLGEVFVQVMLSGFVVANGWPIYEAMVLRSDKGMMPRKVTLVSAVLVWVLCALAAVVMKN